jgi:hypothetical protein
MAKPAQLFIGRNLCGFGDGLDVGLDHLPLAVEPFRAMASFAGSLGGSSLN